MHKILVILFIFLNFTILFSQNINKYNRILKIENLPFNNYEMRVYKKYTISTGLEMFRLYQDNTEKWIGELYTTEATANQQINIKKTDLNLPKNIKLVWAKILDTDLLHLPPWENIQYKLEKKNKDYFTEDDEIVSSVSKSAILDGFTYYLKVKTDKNENEFEYDNPESYLKIYPNVDELISFTELLNLLRSEFRIFHK